MLSRNFRAVQTVLAIAASVALVNKTFALDGFWQGDTSTAWNTASNWYVEGAGAGGFVPQSGGGFNIRAIIGTDSPNGALNTTTGNPAVISGTLTPATKETIGGLYLGLRELDYTHSPPEYVNAEPAAGALVGALTITAGTLNNVSTSSAGFGADGRIVVGADGRGFLTMTGGTLTGQTLIVDGEEYTDDALGTSLVDLSGTATLEINNTSAAANGTAAFNRRLRIEGPDVTVTTSGSVTFDSANSFTAVITGPTTHAMIQSASAVYLGGTLNVEFSGAGATHSVGDTWDLIDATAGLSSNNFSNVGSGGQITVSGLPSDPPVGAAYYIRKVDAPLGHKLLQLAYEGVLVLHVNRDTGEMSITNPQGGDIDIDAYTVRSALGSMKNTYAGITTDTGWSTPGNNPDTGDPLNDAYRLTQWKQTGVYEVDGIGASGISLGDGFDPQGVASDTANFGLNGEDLIFEYSSPFAGVVRGQIVYEGTSFENNLVLRVNPDTGEATLKNDSLETLKIDGYTILSETSALSGTAWTGLGSGWDQTPALSTSLTESNLLGETELAPGAELAIGDISASGFTSEAAQEGLGLQFILAEGFESSPPGGDYNEDGAVNIADYNIWRNNLGASITLPNENPDATTPGVVDAEDYDFWKAQFGSAGGAQPETEFRIGSVVFDTTLGASGAALAGVAVPEPGTALLLGIGCAALGVFRRNRRVAKTRNHLGAGGGSTMSKRTRFSLMAAGVLAALLMTHPAIAQTQGISLINGDFELPGPPDEKTIVFDSTGMSLDNIDGWTFPGPGVEDFGHDDHENGDALGDSGTEGGGNPGNEMFLSTLDGVVYQTSSFNVVSVPSTQKYQLSFDAHNIYTILAEGAPEYEETQNQLTARLYYLAANGTTRTTIGEPLVIDGLSVRENYTLDITGGSAALTPALGRPIGVEFDCTSDEFNPDWVEHSWAGIDNVLLQITGVLEGDLDGDGDLDIDDYAIVRDHQQQAQMFNAQGELTGDGLVDLNDFREFKTAYESHNGVGSFAALLQSTSVPEPSALAILVVLVTVAICLKYRRLLPVKAGLASLVVLGLATAPASAELFFYDPFLIGTNPAAGEYVADTPLAGQNPVAPYGTVTDFFTGAWSLGNSTDAANGMVKSGTGLSYIGAPAEGGSAGAVEDSITFEAPTRVGRYLNESWTDETEGTYYISWLQNFGTIADPSYDMGFRAVEMWSATGTVGDDDAAFCRVGYNAYYSSFAQPLSSLQRAASTARMKLAVGAPGDRQDQILENSPSSFSEDGATHLIVMKFVLSAEAASDTVSLYLDPTSTTEPDLPSASFSGEDITLGALGFSQFGGAGGNYNTIDELRVADAWIDALPELPLPGDTDGDRDVDLDDYNNIITHMNMQVGTALEGDVAKADGTQGSDGWVTIADFRIWKDNYPSPAAGTAAIGGGEVPEPAAWLLMLTAAMFVAGSGCRRSH